jgi:hypothetical protein
MLTRKGLIAGAVISGPEIENRLQYDVKPMVAKRPGNTDSPVLARGSRLRDVQKVVRYLSFTVPAVT